MKTKYSARPRIGVVICTCGGQIAEKVNTRAVEKKAAELEYVVQVAQVGDLCKKEGLSKFKREFKGCDRILFAGCSERSSLTFTEDRISALLGEMGMDRAMFEVANLREQCVWVHDGDLTDKAVDLVRMAHAKLKSNVPTPAPARIIKKSLVIGGGPAGVQAAVDLASAGTEVTLVEKKAYLGGHFCQIPYLVQCEGWPSMCVSDCVAPVQAREAIFNPLVRTLTNSEVTDLVRHNGNFRVKISSGALLVDPDKCISCGKCAEVCPEEYESEYDCGLTKRKAIDKEYRLGIPDHYVIKKEVCSECGECVAVCPTGAINLAAEPESAEDLFGTVILATGFKTFDVNALTALNYSSPNVMSSMEMERLLAARLKRPGAGPVERVAFALCSGSRAKDKINPEGMPYCSKTCCGFAVKQANRITAMNPNAEVSMVYFGDIRTYGRAFEQFYSQAKESVDFINGEITAVEDGEEGLLVRLATPDGAEEQLETDLLVLAEALLPGGSELIDLLKIKTDRYNYPLELQPRILRPTESYIDRVYVAGALTGPKLVQQSVEQGSVAALKALSHVVKGQKDLPKFTSEVDPDKCSHCRICVMVCPHGAISMSEYGAAVDRAFCQGCGLCVSACPSHAVQLRNFYEEQILEQVEAAFSEAENGGPKILGLLCYWCSYASADLMGINGHKITNTNFRSVRIRCSSSVNTGLILEIFKRGADGIIIAGCPPKNCHHGAGNYMTARRVMLLNTIMRQLGLDGRLKWEFIGVPMWRELADAVHKMDKTLKDLGPSPLGRKT